ncbi:MAG: flagellar hook-associated protein FlgK [Verrucomicrobiota bacterium]
MLGIFGTLNLATRSLSTQRIGTEVAGHNLANVNNPAYARQRVEFQSSITIPSAFGPQGTGAEVSVVRQLRDGLLDKQIQNETSVRGWLEAQQQALQYAQANLGQEIDRQASGAEGSAAAGSVGGQHGLSESIADFFNGWQSLSTNPTSSAERQVLLLKAQNLATQFGQVATRLDEVHASLNESLGVEVDNANQLLADIAKLNEQITSAEVGGRGSANDLRDVRQQRLEDLAQLVKFNGVTQKNGGVDIVVDGQTLVSGGVVADKLEAYDPGSGSMSLRLESSGVPVSLTSGKLQGIMEGRDGALADLRSEVDQLAAQLISRVNQVHAGGFDLNGGTGEAFFTGTGAADMGVNSVLAGNPSRVQAAGVSGAASDNKVALQLAQLANEPQAGLQGQTFSQRYGQSVAGLGQSLSSVNAQLNNQEIVESMLTRQRDAVSGVSLDEEMTDLMRFQRAFEASARLVNTLDEMLQTLVSLGR